MNRGRADRRTGGRLALAWGVLLAATPAAAQTIAITGGTVFPVSGGRIQNGTVVIRDGRIVAVGAGVAVPAGAQVVDARGKWITPGLIHTNANAGLGVAGLGGFGEGSVQGEVNPSFNPAEGFDPAAATIPVARTGGVTTAVLGPDGSFFPGQAFAVDYDGSTVDGVVVRRGAAMVLNLSAGSRQAGGGSRAGVMARVRRIFGDALEYSRRQADYRRDQIQELAAPARELEALLPVLRGEMPLVVLANRKIDIENALRLKREYRLRMLLFGAVEGWQVAGQIAQAGVPVLVQPLRDIPDFDGLGARLDNATLLREAGVTVVIAQGDPGGERNLRYAAGNAVLHGMSWDDALKAITQAPAAAFGLTGYGTLEPGAVANVVVWSGDPFEFSSAAERVFVRGRESSLRTREHELRERYRALPPIR
ncbi:MAG TPA: amidohydrolase family protein [Gemmatimonadales bacterium]|nr:amidohydrolase family protein [Gemmatimonadales bacterium]